MYICLWVTPFITKLFWLNLIWPYIHDSLLIVQLICRIIPYTHVPLPRPSYYNRKAEFWRKFLTDFWSVKMCDRNFDRKNLILMALLWKQISKIFLMGFIEFLFHPSKRDEKFWRDKNSFDRSVKISARFCPLALILTGPVRILRQNFQ